METIAKTASVENEAADCVVVGIFNPKRLSPSAKKLDKMYKGNISNACQRGLASSGLGQVTTLHTSARSKHPCIVVVGCGKQEKFTVSAYQKVLSAAINEVKRSKTSNIINCLHELQVEDIDAMTKAQLSVTAFNSSMYVYSETKSSAKTKVLLKKQKLLASTKKEISDIRDGIEIGQAIANGMSLAKELGNLPGNICTPTYLAEQALALKKGNRKLKVDVLEEAQMKKLGMGALLAVSNGSIEPAKLVCMQYNGGNVDEKPIVLVGKGITFDTGGISLKPGASMDEMKFDMCGAASVIGTMKACCELELPINVVGVMTCAENMPDGRATKPGDVVTTMSGQTVEILNTDAEGRLVLCDALTYVDKFEPEVVIDIATLTGACVVALGQIPSGVMSNDDELAKDLIHAGEQTGDRTWQLPIWDEYQSQLDSNFADIANIGGRWGGTITAGCFLSRFTKKYTWAHLDIAGVAWHQGKEKGATGRPVPLLTEYLIHQAYEF
ncbi:MAG: leucyl aminopeptidase [Pseudomonadota bacterium]